MVWGEPYYVSLYQRMLDPSSFAVLVSLRGNHPQHQKTSKTSFSLVCCLLIHYGGIFTTTMHTYSIYRVHPSGLSNQAKRGVLASFGFGEGLILGSLPRKPQQYHLSDAFIHQTMVWLSFLARYQAFGLAISSHTFACVHGGRLWGVWVVYERLNVGCVIITRKNTQKEASFLWPLSPHKWLYCHLLWGINWVCVVVSHTPTRGERCI